MFKFNSTTVSAILAAAAWTCWKSLKKRELTFGPQWSASQKQSVSEKLSVTTGWSIDPCKTVPAEPQRQVKLQTPTSGQALQNKTQTQRAKMKSAYQSGFCVYSEGEAWLPVLPGSAPVWLYFSTAVPIGTNSTFTGIKTVRGDSSGIRYTQKTLLVCENRSCLFV